MSIDLTGWKGKDASETSTMCARPELESPVYNVSEFFLGQHWAMWPSGKLSAPFHKQIAEIVYIMEQTYDDLRPEFDFEKSVVEKFQADAANL